jgi:hypothetical protein
MESALGLLLSLEPLSRAGSRGGSLKTRWSWAYTS